MRKPDSPTAQGTPSCPDARHGTDTSVSTIASRTLEVDLSRSAAAPGIG